MDSTTTPVVSVKNLGIRRSERWLFQALSFSVSEGEAVQVTGKNGAGKTSLLRGMCGLLPVQEGEIHWRTVEEVPIIPTFLGHLAAVKGDLTVLENILYHPINGKFPDEARIETALIEVGLGQYVDRSAKHLSAGQVRRVALARLLLSDAECWVLDEPFTALDVNACKWLEGVISTFVKAGGTVLLTSHQAVHLDVPLKEMKIEDDMSHYV